MDLKFQVRARYSIFEDRSQLLANGFTYVLTAELNYQLSEDLEIRTAVFYTPLDVIRDSQRGSQNDALVNGRILVAYSLK